MDAKEKDALTKAQAALVKKKELQKAFAGQGGSGARKGQGGAGRREA